MLLCAKQWQIDAPFQQHVNRIHGPQEANEARNVCSRATSDRVVMIVGHFDGASNDIHVNHQINIGTYPDSCSPPLLFTFLPQDKQV